MNLLILIETGRKRVMGGEREGERQRDVEGLWVSGQ